MKIFKDKRFSSLLTLSLITIITGTVFYHYTENLNWLDSIYFSAVTLTTVGYGDFVPVTNVGKIFTIFYLFIGIGIIFGFISFLADYRIKKRIHKHIKKHAIKGKIE